MIQISSGISAQFSAHLLETWSVQKTGNGDEGNDAPSIWLAAFNP